MNENEFETIIERYPDLIEEGLNFIGRQVNIKGKYIDLLFKDRHGQKLIVELKKGSILRKHVGQLMDYEGHLISPDDPTVRVMLVGNRVPHNLRRSLDHHGFEWKEIPISLLVNFLQKKDDAELLKYFSEEDLEMKSFTKKKSVYSNTKTTKTMPQLHTIESFDDLKKVITIRSKKIPTNYMDLLLLHNKNKILSQILKEYRLYADKINNKDFLVIGKIKAHIKYRQSKGWIFEFKGDPNDPVVILSSFNPSRKASGNKILTSDSDDLIEDKELTLYLGEQRFENLAKQKKWRDECTKLTVHRQIQLASIFDKYGGQKIPFSHFTKEICNNPSLRNSEVYPAVCAYLSGILKKDNDALIKPDGIQWGLRELSNSETYWL